MGFVDIVTFRAALIDGALRQAIAQENMARKAVEIIA